MSTSARQEEEFAAEMQWLEEEAVREAEEQRIAEEKKKEEERLAEERKKEEERIAEQEKQEEACCAQAQDAAFCRMVEESRKEKAKAAQELAERWERAASAASRRMGMMTPREPSGSKQKIYKLAAIVCDLSDEEIAEGKEKEKGITPRGVKRNRLRMIGGLPGGDSDPGSEEDDDDEEPEPSNKTPLVGKPRPALCVTANGNDAVGGVLGRREENRGKEIWRGRIWGEVGWVGMPTQSLGEIAAILVRREEREMGRENTIDEEEEEEEEKDGEGTCTSG
ncbi:hypothetical protein F5050DRAFT_1804495 [Lentinula boryana]|uniref:Uncharacterized protein n=1 Tax=Lentinula boryana TaxID=40481 RepID=A0ABQ8QNP8_9AGAR|nr:hypothetical protein F5050DRAFT_1804495 [Lentinula boryana]